MAMKNWRLGRVLSIGAVAMAAVLLLAACGGSKSDDGNSADNSGTTPAASSTEAACQGYYCGAVPSQAIPKPDITLTDTSGQPFNIATDTKGDLTLVYLGYTHCPDVCPTFMAQLGKVMKQMPPDVTSKMKVIFVTTDPARDTPTVLRKWLDSFDTKFIGLTGTDAQIAKISNMVGMPAPEKEPLAGGGYGVSHGSLIYAFDKSDGKAHLAYPEGFEDSALVNDFTKLATEGFQASKANVANS